MLKRVDVRHPRKHRDGALKQLTLGARGVGFVEKFREVWKREKFLAHACNFRELGWT